MRLLLQKSQQYIKDQNFSATNALYNWRFRVQQNQLSSQISTILKQRNNWLPLLQNLNLLSKLNPSLFFKILQKTQSHPQSSLDFFNWAKTNLGFQPDLKSHCHIIHVAIDFGICTPVEVKQLFDSLVENHPYTRLADCLIRSCKGGDSQSDVLSFVLECYSQKSLFIEGLAVFKIMRIHACTPTIRASNALLDALIQQKKIGIAWCFLGGLIRSGLCLAHSTWSLVAQILSKNGKFDKLVGLLDYGICTPTVYNLVVDGYSVNGDFKSAFYVFDDMFVRKVAPNFAICSSILDGASKHKNEDVIERIISIMVERGLLPQPKLFDYDSIVQKLSDLGKPYAAEFFFRRACDEKIQLEDDTYGCLLMALSKSKRINESIWLYHIISENIIVVDDEIYLSFVNLLCNEDPSDESCELLKCLVNKGLKPSAEELSKYLESLCCMRKWRQAEDFLTVILDKNLTLDFTSCYPLMKHYCSSRPTRIDLAVALHDKLVKMNVSFDVRMYNVLLNGLFGTKRVEEAVRVFDYMRRQNLVCSEGFGIMIRGLCRIKELRKAMKLHDEMIRLGLKPDKAIYKRLISGFK